MSEQELQQTPIDKRKYPRIDLPRGMMVAWQGGARREISRINSLSLGGIFVITTNPAIAGTLLQLVIELPGGDVRARGSVVYVQPGRGMGIQFRGMRTEERARLAHLLKRLLQ